MLDAQLNEPADAPLLHYPAAITHLAEVEEIVPNNDTGKLKIVFNDDPTAIVLIPRPEVSEGNIQSLRDALRERVLAVKTLDDVCG